MNSKLFCEWPASALPFTYLLPKPNLKDLQPMFMTKNEALFMNATGTGECQK
jgi:hypothetical protein